MYGSLSWFLEDVALLMEEGSHFSIHFRQDLYLVYLNTLLALNAKEQSKEGFCSKYQVLRQISSLLDREVVVQSTEFTRLLQILDVIFVKVYIKEDIDGLVMPKVCLNMGLVK
jgi:hypothetical protein